MTVTDDLRKTHRDLWEQAAWHPFIQELGDGSLPLEKFRRYFLQDYVFVKDLVAVLGLAIAKAPDMDSSGKISEFQAGILGSEDDLFLRAFKALEVPEQSYRDITVLPTTTAFGDFLVRNAYEGVFEHICCMLYVTEGVYMDWGTRLKKAGASPSTPFYQEWIDIHDEETLG
ncbi:MAG: TenA family protein, partial [Chloroflexota bacterium]